MISRVLFFRVHAQIDVLYMRMYAFCRFAKSEIADTRNLYVRCLERWSKRDWGARLFVQESWPRAATLAPFLGDRFVGTTTPRKAETDVPYNCHGNIVRATESFTLCRTRPLAWTFHRELIHRGFYFRFFWFRSRPWTFHREVTQCKHTSQDWILKF